MTDTVKIAGRPIGDGHPAYIIGEIGLNHNGDVQIAKKLIDVASSAGCDAVKFQKRTPELCVPPDQQQIERQTPWGTMTYLEYRHRVELDQDDYGVIDRHCKEKGVRWFASCWDTDSIDFLERFNPPCYKVASASLTDHALLETYRQTERPLILSTGMSTMEQIESGVAAVQDRELLIAHATSTYPCKPAELNLRMIPTLRGKFNRPIGYSGHETGLQTTVAAVVLGASFVERHITLDRTMWGSDHAASVEPQGLMRLVRDIRVTEEALGNGVKRVYDSEAPIMKKLRKS